jgi:high affinity sulfate transporter 1
VLPLDQGQVPTDVIAGVTLAALAIPEVMGYSTIAGMPVITGLYTLVLPVILFALLGSSRHLVVGADSATAAIMAAGLVGLAATGSSKYVALAGVTAIITGVVLMVARLARLGFLADFLSRSVLIGFLTGVGIQVAAGQVAGMLGVPGGGTGTIDKLVTALSQIGQTSVATLLFSAGVIIVILGSRMISRKIPGALIAVIGSIIVSSAMNAGAHGVALVGSVPSGLPHLAIPNVTWKTYVLDILPLSISLFVVIIAQSAATSRAYAARYNERCREDADLVGLSLANVSAGLSGTFVVNGSPTKTQMVDSAGGRSQLSQLTAALLTIIVLLFLTGPLAHMPTAVLDAVVFLIGLELIDIAGMRRVLAVRSDEFAVAGITAAVVVLVGVEQAILLALALSLIYHVRRGYKPKNVVLAVESSGHYVPMPVHTRVQIVPGLIVYRFTHSLYYANAELFSEEVLDLTTQEAATPVRWFCVDANAIDDVDYSGGETLLQICASLKERGVRLAFVALEPHVRRELERSGVVQVVGSEAFYDRIGDVLDAFERQTGETAPAP